MRYFIFLSVLCLSGNVLQAQDVPAIGNIVPEELQMKTCSFDPEAEAVILVNEAVAGYGDQYELITWHHVRLKILNEKGIGEADVSIPYYSRDNFEFISDIEGIVINSSAGGSPSLTYLDKKTIFDKKVNSFYSEKRFGFPSVKTGSIIEYRYKSTMKHYGGLSQWYFQKELPVVYSRYTVTIIPNYEFAYQVQKNDRYKITIQSDNKTGTTSFEMRNIPGLRDEPYMDAPQDYLQMVKFQLSGMGLGINQQKYNDTWPKLARDFYTDKYFGGQLNDKLSGTEDFIAEVKNYNSDLQKMAAVYDFVRRNMIWTGIHSRFSPDGIKTAWNKKNGTSGDINLILINLLKAAGLDADAALVSERGNGRVNKDYPFQDQFNSVYATVTINGKRYFLNATDKYTPAHITPYSILNTTVFIITRKSGELVDVTDEGLMFSDHFNNRISLDANGNISGTCYVSSSDYAKAERLRWLNNGKEEYINHWFKPMHKNIAIDSFHISNENIDTLPLESAFRFQLPSTVTGDYIFIPANFFTGMKENVFLATNRFTHINFGYRQRFTSALYISLPPEYVTDVLPKSVKLVNTDKSMNFTRQVITDEKDRSKLLLRYQIEFSRSLYTAADYPDIKEFYKKMFDFLGEQIVLKKKPSE